MQAWDGRGWVYILPANTKGHPQRSEQYRRFRGAMMQTPADASVDEMVQGDLQIPSPALGERFAKFVARHKAG